MNEKRSFKMGVKFPAPFRMGKNLLVYGMYLCSSTRSDLQSMSSIDN